MSNTANTSYTNYASNTSNNTTIANIIVSPSILSADFCNLKRDCEKLISYGADWLHIDIMDGHFVPNLTIGPPIIQSLRSHFPSAFLDCHLMIENPELWIERVYKSGASSITFHLEATMDPVLLARKIKSLDNCLCAVAIKPDTAVSDIPTDLFPLLDMILVMTVEPGFGGQKLIESCVGKVKELRESVKFDKLIQVDGGVDETNIESLKAAGANVIVAGSSIFKSSNPQSIINLFKSH